MKNTTERNTELVTEHYDNGQKMEERNYKDGKAEGKWTTWECVEEYYKDGKLVKTHLFNLD